MERPPRRPENRLDGGGESAADRRDRTAVRAVVYDDRRGGYIDNVPATFTRKNTDFGIHYANFPAVGGQCPDGLPTLPRRTPLCAARQRHHQ